MYLYKYSLIHSLFLYTDPECLFFSPSTIAIAALILIYSELKIDCKNWIQLLPDECLAINSIFALKNECCSDEYNDNNENIHDINSNNTDNNNNNCNKRKIAHNNDEIKMKKNRNNLNNNEKSSLDIDVCYVALQKIKLPSKYRDIINIHRNKEFPVRNITPSSIVELENMLK